MTHFYIIGAGTIPEAFVKNQIEVAYIRGETLILVAVDAGVEFFYRNRIRPDVIIGDFDSADEIFINYYKQNKNIRFEELKPEKDDTDMEHAVRDAIAQGADAITIFGATGSRIDHTLGNIALLGIGLEKGVPIMLLDDHNRIRMIDTGITLKNRGQFGDYISLIPYTPEVTGLTITGMKYPMLEGCLSAYNTRGVSNEIVEEEAEISFMEGILLVIESKD